MQIACRKMQLACRTSAQRIPNLDGEFERTTGATISLPGVGVKRDERRCLVSAMPISESHRQSLRSINRGS